MKYYSRKDIARLVDCSVAQVRKNEERMGIAEHKQRFNKRVIRYHALRAAKALKDRGLID